MHNKARGFTFIEVMVTIGIVGILAAVAMPSFSAMINSNRLSGEMNTLVGALNVARSEAQKRGTTVSVCAGTATTCQSNWSAGWIVLLESSPKQTLFVRPVLSNGDTITSSVTTYPQFNAAGYTFFSGKLTLNDKNSTLALKRCLIFGAGSWVTGKGAACTTP